MNPKHKLLETVRWAEHPTHIHVSELELIVGGRKRVKYHHQNSWHYPDPVGEFDVRVRMSLSGKHLEVACPVCSRWIAVLQLARHAIVHFPKLPTWEWKVNEWVDEEGVHHGGEYYHYTGGLERPERIRADRWFWSTGVSRLCPMNKSQNGTPDLPPGQ